MVVAFFPVLPAGRCERVRANLGTTRARGEVDMEITLRKMQHKEDKMQRTASQFQEMEQTVYNSLFTLIKDTSVLRDYAAAALLIINVSGTWPAWGVPVLCCTNQRAGYVHEKGLPCVQVTLISCFVHARLTLARVLRPLCGPQSIHCTPLASLLTLLLCSVPSFVQCRSASQRAMPHSTWSLCSTPPQQQRATRRPTWATSTTPRA